MLVGIAILCFIYAPLLTLLRAPPTKEEKKVGDVVTVANGTTNLAIGSAATIGNGVKPNDLNGAFTTDRIGSNGIFNKALTLDNGDLAVPSTQHALNNGANTTVDNCVTKL